MIFARKITSLFLFAGMVFAYTASAEVVDRIIIVINNEVITQREVDRILEPIYEQYRALYYGDELIKKLEEARRKVIDQLIDDRLILSEAKKLNIEVDERALDARLDEAVKRFKSKEAFEKELQAQNISINELRSRYKEQMMVRRLVDQKIGSRIMISPSEISDYYSKHINEFVRPEEIKLTNILIRPKGNTGMAAAERLAGDILKRIREGCDFAGLAREYSDGPNAAEGGSMGYVKKGDLLPDLEVVVFNLKEGEVSDVIRTSLGFHIFKVEEKVERRTLELAEVKRDIEEMIFREKIKDSIKNWVEKLKKNAYIEYK